MLRNILIVLLLALGLLILADRVRHSQESPSPLPPAVPGVAAGSPPGVAPAPARPMPPTTVTAPPVAPTATPALDLFARLAVRRRLAREGSQVYLDSLFLHTDSTLTRWYERSTLVVELVPDTTLARWTPVLLEEARTGMRAWNAIGVSPTFREATATDTADITVRWVDMVADSGLVGSTTLTWGRDGVVKHATVTLALRRNVDSLVLPPQARARIAIHELGHALGLPHSGNSDDIMFRTSPVTEPSARDQATLRLLYVLFPGPLRVQP